MILIIILFSCQLKITSLYLLQGRCYSEYKNKNEYK